MDILFQGSVAKHLDSPEDNEDAFNVVAQRDRIVVCDGASESFDAKKWARLLADKFAEEEIDLSSVSTCIEAFEALHDPSSMGWAKAGAYERGSFATALIAQDIPPDLVVSLTCAGDSAAFLTDGATILESLPYTSSADFEKRPILLSTLDAHNRWLEADGPQSGAMRAKWSYAERRPLFLLCMTDALAAWLLRTVEQRDPTGLERLMSIRTDEELAQLVEGERTSKLMRRDDSTLIIALL
jgi:hypothetical protein